MKQFTVGGMSCAACSARVEKAVSSLSGVETCSVNLLTNSMVELDGSLYIGAAMGVWEYEKESGDSYWYPIDYNTYLAN